MLEFCKSRNTIKSQRFGESCLHAIIWSPEYCDGGGFFTTTVRSSRLHIICTSFCDAGTVSSRRGKPYAEAPQFGQVPIKCSPRIVGAMELVGTTKAS